MEVSTYSGNIRKQLSEFPHDILKKISLMSAQTKITFFHFDQCETSSMKFKIKKSLLQIVSYSWSWGSWRSHAVLSTGTSIWKSWAFCFISLKIQSQLLLSFSRKVVVGSTHFFSTRRFSIVLFSSTVELTVKQCFPNISAGFFMFLGTYSLCKQYKALATEAHEKK